MVLRPRSYQRPGIGGLAGHRLHRYGPEAAPNTTLTRRVRNGFGESIHRAL
ncbi:hypothetical protein ON05_010285 [Acaryochloris sp. CCMEE 5410]|nr:hypothetical protein ON05_010285 [Acaryochloris sp. CCMEE 5410]